MIARIQVKRGDNVIIHHLVWLAEPPVLHYLDFWINEGRMEWCPPPDFEILRAQDVKIEIDFVEPDEPTKA